MISFSVTMEGNLLTLRNGGNTYITARKQGFMSHIEVVRKGRCVEDWVMHRDKAPKRLIELAKEYMK